MFNTYELRYNNNIYSPKGLWITVSHKDFTAMHEAGQALKSHGYRPIDLTVDLFKDIGFTGEPDLLEGRPPVAHQEDFPSDYRMFFEKAPDSAFYLLDYLSVRMSRPLFYFHQVQNLIFDITGRMPTV